MFYKGGKMLIRIIFAILIAFALGMLVSMMVDASPVVEQAQDTVKIFSNSQDVPSPSDTIKQEDIHVYANRVEIDIAGAIPAVFTDTNSMDPVFDFGATAIELPVTDPNVIQVGDIVSYVTPLAPGSVIVHRVVEIGEDEEGLYFIFKGDNNPTTDPDKVRPEQLQRKVIGILY